MASVNKVILVGNCGKDPEIRSTQDGREIANFSLATSEKWKNKQGEQQERTEWHKVAVFSEGLVNVIKNYVKKGSKLYLEGQLQTRKWTDKDGAEKYSTEVVLQGYNAALVMLDSKRDDEEKPEPKKTTVSNNIDDDLIPFSFIIGACLALVSLGQGFV